MPGNWRLKKKWNSQKEIREQKTKNSKEDAAAYSLSKRRKTFAGGEATGRTGTRRSKSTTTLHSAMESPEHSYATNRHYMRRPALLIGSDRDAYLTSPETQTTQSSLNFITVSLEDGNMSFKRTLPVKSNRKLEDMLKSVFHKQGLSVDDFDSYHITACKGGKYLTANLQALATEYLASVIEIQPLRNIVERRKRTSISPTDQLTVQCCLEYFENNGIVEIPMNSHYAEDDSFHLPRVTPLDPIESSWEELDIDPKIKKSLSDRMVGQQQAIWELIATEHSFLRQLETVINLFMRALELIRRTGLLTEVNYQNVFGYMEQIYISHEQFWSWTLQPCLEKVHQKHTPLDLDEIILRFPIEIARDFEIYEQHCAFEQTNLHSLNEAMDQKDFKTYLEWCESQPQCERLKLKDFLAKPMQRLTKYSLLFRAILNRTSDPEQIKELEQMMNEMSLFVNSVNNVLRAQDETKRVEEIMKKIVGYNPVELTGEFKEAAQPYVQLDLLAPMPDVDITRPRILIVEGKLRYKDNHTRALVVHVFLFSDMLLITKTRGTDRYVIFRPPFKISQLHVVHKESGNILFMAVNDFKVLSDIFTLKAHSADIAQEWTDHIASAQEYYTAAIERKAQSWRIFEYLQQERTLHGISQDIIAAESGNGAHWSTQSISGSPVPSCSGSNPSGEFRRVPSSESTFSNSSSVFPMESPLTPSQERRHSCVPLRASSFDQASLYDHHNSNVENHRVSFPFCSQSKSPQLQRPGWHRAGSLNTLMGHFSGEPLLTDFVKRKRESFQKTLKDVTTQTDEDTSDLSVEDLDIDMSSSGEYSPPVLISPTTPINIIVSPASESPLRHRRSKSESKSFDFFSSHESQNSESPSSPMNSPVGTNGSSDSGHHSQHEEKPAPKPPSNFRFPPEGSRLKLHRQSAFQLSKIYEHKEEESYENEEEKRRTSSFTRGGTLRRSKSNMELSYGSRMLKPPSPLTTHMQRSRESLHKLLSNLYDDHQLSPILSPKLIFMGDSMEDDEYSDSLPEQPSLTVTASATNHKPFSTSFVSFGEKSGDGKHDVKKNNKRIKSAGPNKVKRGFFSLFRSRSVSMDNILDHVNSSPSIQQKTSPKLKSHQSSPKLQHNLAATSSQQNLAETNPHQSPGKLKSQINLAKSRSHQSLPVKPLKLSLTKYNSVPKTSLMNSKDTSPTHHSTVRGSSLVANDLSHEQALVMKEGGHRTVRMSLQLTPPNHKVVFLSPVAKRSKSTPCSPDVNFRLRRMQVFPSELTSSSTILNAVH